METRYFKRPFIENNTFDKDGNLAFNPKDDIAAGVTGLRPSVKDPIPVVEVEKIEGKTVFHNYGHSGLGWTLFWGSCLECYSQFEAKFPELPKNTPLTIVGAGIVGCGMFTILREKGFTNLTIIADDWEDSASWKAGAILGMTSKGFEVDNKAQKQKIIKYYLETFKWARSVLEGKSSFQNVNKGLREEDAYSSTEEGDLKLINQGAEVLVEEGLVEPEKKVIVDFGSVKRTMNHIKTFYYDVPKVMAEFHGAMKGNSRCINKKIDSFSELEDNIVFNCSGLGANGLVTDNPVIPICGHALKLNSQPILKGIFRGIFKENNSIFYYYPKSDGKTCWGIIGGTFEKDYIGNNPEFDAKRYNELYMRAKKFFGLPTINPKF